MKIVFLNQVPLPDLPLDLSAIDAVMQCEELGIRAYAIAGGLNPETDFRGLNMRGWDLSGQDLRGFDLTGCDLRETGIERALTDATTIFEGVTLDEGITPGACPDRDHLNAVAEYNQAVRS